jgi:2,3-bisphosphoglycerate-independent phosphoglycerate mutase
LTQSFAWNQKEKFEEKPLEMEKKQSRLSWYIMLGAVDTCVGRVVKALKDNEGECFITADHGNAEQMQDPVSGQAHTAHTCEPVPLIYVGRNATPAATGTLSDISPSLLNLMGIEQPEEMTGSVLMQLTK